MARIYLYVPFEEEAEVKALGARLDDESKCWYIEADEDSEKFRQWLPGGDAGDEDPYSIVADHANIASAKTTCWSCHSDIEVICVYCESGLVDEEPYTDFSVSNITAVDSELEKQLQNRWPLFRRAFSEELGAECFVNHCPHCGALQDEFLLHCEPGGPFFKMRGADPDSIRYTRLAGTIQLSGDEGTEL